MLSAPVVGNGVTTALATPAVIWSFSEVTDSISLSYYGDNGYTYCGARSYAISGHGTWLTLSSKTLTLSSNSVSDYISSPYTVTLTVGFSSYS